MTTPAEPTPPHRGLGRPTPTPTPAGADPTDWVGRERRIVSVDLALGRMRLALGIVIIAVAAMVLVIGWFGGVDIVTRLHSSLVSMKANTAVGFLCIGGVLVTVDGRWSRWSPVLAGAACALGTATVIQYAFEVDLGIDEVLVSDPAATLTSSPGRMGLNTAIAFALVGAGRLAGARPIVRHVEEVLVGAAAGLSFLAFTGYLYAVSGTRGLGSATEMALHTSLLFLCYCVGITDVLSQRRMLAVLRSPFAGGRMYRVVLPTVAVVVVVVAIAVQQLETLEVLDSPELVLAFTTSTTLAMVLVAALVLAIRMDQTDRAATATRSEIERREAEFNAELRALNRTLEARVIDRTKELARANADLSRSNRDLEQFAYVASHDLREPLRMVSSFVHKLSDRYGTSLDERGQQYVAFALDGAERMSTMLDSILALSRASRSEVRRRDVDVPAVVARLVPMLPENAEVHVGDVPTVRTDEDLLSQVLQNLLSNAGKFTDPDHPPRIEVSGTRVDGGVLLHVDDAGPGIPAEHRDRVFQLFHRLQPTSETPGTGIGLTLVDRIVDRLGGSIRIDDAPIGGARFTIVLPDGVDAPGRVSQ